MSRIRRVKKEWIAEYELLLDENEMKVLDAALEIASCTRNELLPISFQGLPYESILRTVRTRIYV
jgi:hypothetical protein